MVVIGTICRIVFAAVTLVVGLGLVLFVWSMGVRTLILAVVGRRLGWTFANGRVCHFESGGAAVIS